MIRYIKMKLFYRKIRMETYLLFENFDETLDFAKRLIKSCENMTGDDLRKEFIHELAGFAHEQAQRDLEKEKSKE